MAAKKRVIAYLHTHWDREWYRTKEEFNLRLLEVFDEILEELQSGSMPCFYFDGQTAALEDYLKFRPENLKIVTKLIKSKKLFIGPFYASADSFLVSGISLIRNLNFGIEYSKSFGVTDFIGYLPDTFGHSRSIFDILKAFNIANALAWRGIGPLPHNDFKINGINATRLVYGYFMDVLHPLERYSACFDDFCNLKSSANADFTVNEIIKIVQSLEKILDKIAQNSDGDLLLPIGADHLAALKDSSKIVNIVNKYLQNYEIELKSPFEYTQNADYSHLSMHGELLDNTVTYILPGVYSSRIPQKVENAKLQWDLFRIVEPLNHFAEYLGINSSKYAASLDFAAKELIKNHAHDSIYGCSTDEVHKCVQARFDKVKAVIYGVKQRLIRDLICKFTQNADYTPNKFCTPPKTNKNQRAEIFAFNLSNFEYSGPVSVISNTKMSNAQLVRKFRGFSDEILYNTRKIPVTEQYLPMYEYLVQAKCLKPFAFAPIECVQIQSELEITENKISNSLLELNLRREKDRITLNLFDKRAGIQYFDALKIIVSEDFGDSYNSACPKKPIQYKLLGAKIVEKGPIRAALRLLFENNFKLDVYLSNYQEFFEFEAKFNNNRKNQKIQACFNLKSPIESTFAEDAFGFIERKHDYNWLMREHMQKKKKIEVFSNSFPMQKWVMAQNFGVVTFGLNEYEIHKSELKITLMRGTARISEPKNLARFIPAGPPIETPDLQCLGFHKVKFACVLNSDIALMQRVAETFYAPVVPILGRFLDVREKKLLNLPENLLFYGLKTAGNKTCGVFYNTSHVPVIYNNVSVAPKSIEFIELQFNIEAE